MEDNSIDFRPELIRQFCCALCAKRLENLSLVEIMFYQDLQSLPAKWGCLNPVYYDELFLYNMELNGLVTTLEHDDLIFIKANFICEH